MNVISPERKISDCVGLPISVSDCAIRVNRDHMSAFSPLGTPHILRFRRIFHNIMEINGYYDIYIDSDLKLLLYGNEQPGFLSVTDNTGTPVNIPVYRFTGREPYDCPLKQPAPYTYVSPEDISRNMAINDLLTGNKKPAEAAGDDSETAENTTAENGKNEIPEEDSLTVIKGADIPNDPQADDLAKPEPIPEPSNSSAADEITNPEDKKPLEIDREIYAALENVIKETAAKQTDEIGQAASVGETVSSNNDPAPLSEDDIDAEQLDIAEEVPLQESAGQSEENNSFEYYASRLIKKPEPPKNRAELSMDTGMSVSVSAEKIHGENEQVSPACAEIADEKNAASENKEKHFSENGEQNIQPDYMDIVNSGAQLQLSAKMGIDNKRLCRIERAKPDRKSKDEEESEPADLFTPIANFCLVPLTIERHSYADNSSKAFVHIAVFSPEFGYGHQMLLLDAEDIEKVGKLVRQKFPQLYYDPDLNSAPKYISAALSIMMSGMPEKNIMHFYGWCNFDGRVIYLNDNIDENPLFKSESGKSLFFGANMYRGDAFLQAFNMLKLSKDINKTLPLFLTAHLGVMYWFFEMAGYAPRFVLFLCGETGSLKTSIGKVFFRTLTDDSNEIPANFNDTMTALEIKMGMTRDEVYMVDDFRPSSMNTELTKMRGNLEKLIRFYGDGVGKGRGSIELKLREEFKPHSMCAVTGEYIHGTASSLQRLLIVSVDKNTYDRGLLKYYQDNPFVFRTHINFFITYLSQNSQRIIPYISNKFIEKREFYSKYLTSKRLVDAAVCMELTAEIILLFYANDSKLVHPMDIQPQLDIWKDCILEFVRESELLSNNREPVDMFCTAIAEIYRNDMLKIPPSKTLYESSIDYAIGYFDYDTRTLYLKPKESYIEAVQYWSKQGIQFVVKEKALRRELLLNGMARGSVDGDSIKSSTPVYINKKAVRMLELDLTKFNDKYMTFALPPSPFVFR